MKAEHVSPDDLALYVMGALAPAPSSALEAHVALCSACAAGLAREARLEVALHDVGAAIGREPRSHRQKPRLRRATAAAFAATVALAAGYLVWIARSSHDVARAAEHPSLVACPPGRGEAALACHARARRMGLYVQDPPRSALIPVYEDITPTGGTAPHR